MAGFSVDASEVFALASKLSGVSPRLIPAIETGIGQITKKMETQWRANATGTSGAHGVHYPSSITSEIHGAEGEVGPDAGLPQGGMSFEEGSRNQPAHLDGAKALDMVEPEGLTLLDHVLYAVLP